MNKPKWEDAPEWANWLAMNSGGRWCWFEHKPELHKEYMVWYMKEGSAYCTSVFSNIKLNPENTLEQRS